MHASHRSENLVLLCAFLNTTVKNSRRVVRVFHHFKYEACKLKLMYTEQFLKQNVIPYVIVKIVIFYSFGKHKNRMQNDEILVLSFKQFFSLDFNQIK